MSLSASFPTWTKIIFVIWIIFTLIVVLILLCCRKKEMPTSSRSPLYEKTKQRVEDFYAKLEKEQLMPWNFFNSGVMPEVKKYYGGTIKYSGVEYSGTPVLVFWEGFIEPFLEHGITEILEQVANDALEKQLNPEPCINEAAGLLDGVISKTYNQMAEIDQRLRGKGNPGSVKRNDVTENIEKMRIYLQRNKESFSKMAASKYQYFLNVESRENKNLWIALIALGASIMSTLIALIALFKK
jgi:hypothetical protein